MFIILTCAALWNSEVQKELIYIYISFFFFNFVKAFENMTASISTGRYVLRHKKRDQLIKHSICRIWWWNIHYFQSAERLQMINWRNRVSLHSSAPTQAVCLISFAESPADSQQKITLIGLNPCGFMSAHEFHSNSFVAAWMMMLMMMMPTYCFERKVIRST